MKAVILAGGKGTRLVPYTRVFPKPLMPIGDMPILEIMLLQLKRAGITDAVLTVGHLSELLRAFFQDGEQIGLNITYSYEDKPLGTAGPLANVKGLEDTFLVANGDVLTTLDFGRLIAYHKEKQGLITIAMHHRNVNIDFGVIQYNQENHVTGYIEKPTIEYDVSMGVYVVEPAALSYVPTGEYFDFPDLIKKLIAAGEKVVSYPFDGYWQDLGRPDDYEQANLEFDQMKSQLLPDDYPAE